jgi:hypothetical protein
MPFEISIVRKIHADQGFVFDWWTDLSSDDSKLVKPLKKRNILSKSDDKILLHDEEEMYFKKMSFDVVVTLMKPDSWIAEYTGAFAKAKSEYKLVTNSEQTTMLVYHSKIEPSGFFTRLFSPVVRYFVKRVFEEEMDIFIQTLEEEFSRTELVP